MVLLIKGLDFDKQKCSLLLDFFNLIYFLKSEMLNLSVNYYLFIYCKGLIGLLAAGCTRVHLLGRCLSSFSLSPSSRHLQYFPALEISCKTGKGEKWVGKLEHHLLDIIPQQREKRKQGHGHSKCLNRPPPHDVLKQETTRSLWTL